MRGLLDFLKPKAGVETNARPSNMTAQVAISTQPLVINPDFSENLKQKISRIDAIERYIEQRTQENRPIPEEKMAHFADEHARLKIEVRQLKAQFERDGGAV